MNIPTSALPANRVPDDCEVRFDDDCVGLPTEICIVPQNRLGEVHLFLTRDRSSLGFFMQEPTVRRLIGVLEAALR